MIGTTNAKYSDYTYTVPSWSTGTDAEIVRALEKHYLGQIDLHDYWSVGDTRTISLSAMSATGVGESHASQTVEMVLMDSTCTGFTLTTEQTTPAFIVGMKDCLNEKGYMNSTDTNSGGWSSSARRTWCNSVFKNALPSTLVSAFKQFTWKQGVGGGASSGLNTTQDYFGLTPEKAIFGGVTNAFSDESALYSQWTHYQTSSNRIKNVNGSAYYWWECSSSSGYSDGFSAVLSDGSANGGLASGVGGLAPFGCI